MYIGRTRFDIDALSLGAFGEPKELTPSIEPNFLWIGASIVINHRAKLLYSSGYLIYR